MIGGNFIAGLLLFWPLVMLLILVGFGLLMFAVVLLSGTVIIISIFLYGLYCLSRDTGLLGWLLEKGGKASDWITGSVKKNVENSFVFVEGASPPDQAIYLCHPHGLYGMTWFLHFSLALTKWPGSQRPIIAVHSIFFKIPILRELFLQNDCIEATEIEIKRCLREGKSVALLVGGIEELNATRPGSLDLVLKKRSGYARIAKEMNVPLVPLVSPGETDLFPPFNNSLWKLFQEFLYKQFHLALPLPSFHSIWSWFVIAYKPFDISFKTYILEAIYPDQKSIEDIKSEYETQLIDFAKDKSIHLTFIA